MRNYNKFGLFKNTMYYTPILGNIVIAAENFNYSRKTEATAIPIEISLLVSNCYLTIKLNKIHKIESYL